MRPTVDPTRRAVLGATAALAAGAAVGAPAVVRAGAAGEAAPAQAPGFYRSRIGAIRATSINDGFGRRPIDGFVRNASTEEVAAALRESFLPEDALEIPFTTLALETEGRLVLIDAGNGEGGAPTTGAWLDNFRAAGYAPEDVDLVLISHFHPDHIGGLVRGGEAAFPSATLRVPEAEWAFWMDDARMAAAPEGMRGLFGRIREAFAPYGERIERFPAGEEVAPGVTAVAAAGHTPGHAAFRIASEGDVLHALGDATNHPALFVRNPGWHVMFDMDPEAAEATRRALLGQAADERIRVALYHAPFPALGHVARAGEGYAFAPIQWTPAP